MRSVSQVFDECLSSGRFLTQKLTCPTCVNDRSVFLDCESFSPCDLAKLIFHMLYSNVDNSKSFDSLDSPRSSNTP